VSTHGRHDFGWSLQVHWCTVCGEATRNRGCKLCCSRFCKSCFSQHTCAETSIAKAKLEHAPESVAESLDNPTDIDLTSSHFCRRSSTTMEEFQRLLDSWDVQCFQERRQCTCKRVINLLEHATSLHRQYGDVFRDIIVRAQACHSLMHCSGCTEDDDVHQQCGQLPEQSNTVRHVESEMDKLYYDIAHLERQAKRSKHQRQWSGASDVSTRASTRAGSPSPDISL